ncbi:class I SAM-dependent methyltransferase [Zooshikella marina]|uniref:class I SAM-dependent methyltransferase n=1 Tax=Zooshikella ganghwensis TaxID=202772 RepID=UPI001BAEB327|nr:class I SAM-dependent methyltransferase [Zooshikella ganghwensis]MBU2708283.1 class I SAM-dependent methyltransferase [Zooshikella ganghwensis]
MSNPLDQLVAAYDDSNPYAFDNEIMLHWYAHRIAKLVGVVPRLLELGIGHGIASEMLSKQASSHTIIEGSESIIQRFKKQYPGCTSNIILSYFEDYLPLHNTLFDVIVMGFVLEHVDDPHAILTKYRHYLAPRGRLFIAVPNADVLNRRLGFYMGLLDDLKELSPNDIALGHQRFYNIDSICQEVRKAGFIITTKEGIYLKPFTSEQMRSLKLNRSVYHALCQVGIEYPELCCGLLIEACVEPSP